MLFKKIRLLFFIPFLLPLGFITSCGTVVNDNKYNLSDIVLDTKNYIFNSNMPWTGTISNDSFPNKQNCEIAISELKDDIFSKIKSRFTLINESEIDIVIPENIFDAAKFRKDEISKRNFYLNFENAKVEIKAKADSVNLKGHKTLSLNGSIIGFQSYSLDSISPTLPSSISFSDSITWHEGSSLSTSLDVTKKDKEKVKKSISEWCKEGIEKSFAPALPFKINDDDFDIDIANFDDDVNVFTLQESSSNLGIQLTSDNVITITPRIKIDFDGTQNPNKYFTGQIQLTPIPSLEIVGKPLPYYSLDDFRTKLVSIFPSEVPSNPLVIDFPNAQKWTNSSKPFIKDKDGNVTDKREPLASSDELNADNIQDINNAFKANILAQLNDSINEICKNNNANSRLSFLTSSEVEITIDTKIALNDTVVFSATPNTGKLIFSYSGLAGATIKVSPKGSEIKLLGSDIDFSIPENFLINFRGNIN